MNRSFLLVLVAEMRACIFDYPIRVFNYKCGICGNRGKKIYCKLLAIEIEGVLILKKKLINFFKWKEDRNRFSYLMFLFDGLIKTFRKELK